MIDTKSIAAQVGGESILFAQRADKLIAKNLIEDAMKLCEAGVKTFPMYPEGHYTLGRCYELAQRYDEAKTEYERTLFYAPEHIQALRALARIYFRNNLTTPGYELLQKAVLINPLDEGLISELKANNLPLPKLGDTGETTVLQEHVEEQVTNEPKNEPVQEAEGQPEAGIQPQEEIVELPETPEMEISGEDVPSGEDESAARLQEDEDTEQIIIDPTADIDEDVPTAIEDDKSLEPEILSHVIETGENEVPVTPDETMDIEEQLFVEEDNGDSPRQIESGESEAIDIHPPDLSQYNNVKDDFSTLMEDIFRPVVDDDEGEEEWAEDTTEEENLPDEEHEQMVEEKPILDTSIIFQEEKRADAIQKEDEAPPEESSETEQLDSITEEKEVAAESIVSDTDLQQEKEAIEEKISAETDEVTEVAQDEDHLTEAIERIEQTDEPKIIAEETIEQTEKAGTPDETHTPSYDKDEDGVDIEDIMSNPSLLTPTFGEILIAQKKFEDARRVFMELSRKDPENPRFKKKIEFLDKLVAINKN